MRKILIADDHPICASALTLAAQSIESGTQVSTVETMADVEAELARENFDMLTLDLALRDSQGLANLVLVRSLNPDLPVLVVSANERADMPRRSATLGANGFLSKSAPIAEMKAAIAIVFDGGDYFPAVGPGPLDADPALELSPAQSRVMVELSKGHANKIIAFELGLSEATIKSHLSAIYRVLGVTNRSQAILALQDQDPDLT